MIKNKLISQVQAIEDCLDYMLKRKNKEIPAFKTCYNNINNALGGSIEPNTIITIAGMSGSGKSTMSKRFIYSITENAIKDNFKVATLCFNYEMLAFKTVGRELSHITKKSVGRMYSSSDTLSDQEYEYIKREAQKLKKYNINYIEQPEDHSGIKKAIYENWKRLCDKDTLLLVEIDHTLLIKNSEDSYDEKRKIDQLMVDLVELKKIISSEGGMVIFIVISQLNRNIEAVDRIKNPNMHRPIKSDIVQSDNLYQSSDYVIVGHSPEKLYLPFYTEKKLPIFITEDPKSNKQMPFIYYHILKNRDGEPNSTCVMISNLKHFEFIEVKLEDFSRYAADWNTKTIYLDNNTKENEI